MIRDLGTYRRERDGEDRAILSALTIEESIAIGEALLTSSLMNLVRADASRPMSLARALGITHPSRRHATRGP